MVKDKVENHSSLYSALRYRVLRVIELPSALVRSLLNLQKSLSHIRKGQAFEYHRFFKQIEEKLSKYQQNENYRTSVENLLKFTSI